jgi:hypothetical protein
MKFTVIKKFESGKSVDIGTFPSYMQARKEMIRDMTHDAFKALMEFGCETVVLDNNGFSMDYISVNGVKQHWHWEINDHREDQ